MGSPSDGSSFAGVFKPPIFSLSGGTPVKLAGPGRCEVGDDQLVCTAFRRVWPSHIKIIFLLGLILAAAILALILPLVAAADSGGSDGQAGLWAVALFVPILLMLLPLIRGYDAHNADKPLTLEIPYERIRSVRRGRVSVVIDVAKGRPKGFIYFEPERDPQALVKALSKKRERS